MEIRRCLITGATGAVGPSVVHALLEQGAEVTILCRSAPAAGLFPVGVKLVLGDAMDARAVQTAVQGQDAVVHLAAFLHVNNPSASVQQDMRRINVEGTRNVVDAARSAGVSRVVFVSTISVYGYGRSEVLTEESVPAPSTTYGESKLAAEKVALSASRPDGVPLSTVLRLAAVYGPRVKGNYQTLLSALSKGKFVPIGRGLNYRTLVHCDDVARAICHALSDDSAAGRTFNVTDGAYHRLSTVIEAMCRALGRSVPRLRVPTAAARAVTRVSDLLLVRLGRAEKFDNLLDKYLEEVRVDGSVLIASGYQPSLGLAEGWSQTVEALRTEGKI